MGRPRLKRNNPLISDFMNQMSKSDHTFQTLAPIAGSNFRTLSEWGLRTQPTLDRFDAAVRAIGCRLVIVRDGGDRS